jgi:succinyl-CoA synthetase beta subunit
MELLEYQAKELFRETGIPVLPSQSIDHPGALKALKIPYPIVLKSQVLASGRGKVGGVRFAENTIDAIAAARNIFSLPIQGEYPQVLLAEAKYNADKEFYLAIVLDYTLRRPVLLGSSEGGINLESVLESMQHIVIDQEFSPFYARRLLVKMGLTGALIDAVSPIVEQMYQLFIQKDLDLIEINPLGVSPTGEVMALDGKIRVNDDALGRHPELSLFTSKVNCHYHLPTVNWTDPDSNLAILCNGTGIALSTLDLISVSGLKPAYFIVVDQVEKWTQALQNVTKDSEIKTILINMIGSDYECEQVVNLLKEYWQNKITNSPLDNSSKKYQKSNLYPQFILRIVSGKNGEKIDIEYPEENLSMQWVETWEDAINQTISRHKNYKKN